MSKEEEIRKAIKDNGELNNRLDNLIEEGLDGDDLLDRFINSLRSDIDTLDFIIGEIE